MPHGATVRDVLAHLVDQQSIVAAVIATADGEVVDVWPTSEDAWEASSMAEWAAEQVEQVSGLRQQIGEPEFSLLFDPHEGSQALHRHLQVVADHILVVLFRDRDYLGRVRVASREAARALAPVFGS